MKSLSCVWLFATPWTISHQAPPSMGFSRQEYWSGLPFPSPGDLPNPGIEPGSPALYADTLLSEPQGKSPSPWVQLNLLCDPQSPCDLVSLPSWLTLFHSPVNHTAPDTLVFLVQWTHQVSLHLSPLYNLLIFSAYNAPHTDIPKAFIQESPFSWRCSIAARPKNLLCS